jgi:hypothetical protein
LLEHDTKFCSPAVGSPFVGFRRWGHRLSRHRRVTYGRCASRDDYFTGRENFLRRELSGRSQGGLKRGGRYCLLLRNLYSSQAFITITPAASSKHFAGDDDPPTKKPEPFSDGRER